jgi:hypothetical protein
MDKIVPSYKIGLVPEKYTTDKNKPFNIIVKISGAGAVINAKLMAYSDLNVKLAKYETGKQEEEYKYETDQFFFGIPIEGFQEREGFETFPTPALKYEFAHDYDVARVRAKALSTGDHVINFVFSYTPDGINWYSDRLEFKFHVNTPMDKYGVWGLIIALLGLIFKQEVLSLLQSLLLLFKQGICNLIKASICK